jgi:hypothetical protein
VRALNLTQAPRTGKFGCLLIVLTYAQAMRQCTRTVTDKPRGLRQHRVEQRSWSNPGVQNLPWAQTVRVCSRNVTRALQMEALYRAGTWWNGEAAHPRGVKGPAVNPPAEGKHRHYARSASSVSPNLERSSRKARAHPALVFPSLYHHIVDIEHLHTCFHLLR